MWLLIAVSVNIKDPGKGDRVALIQRMKGYNNAYVSIGVHEDAGSYTEGSNPPSVVEVALWMEFGTIKTPERSFLRSAINENGTLIDKWINEANKKIIFENWDVRKALSYIGMNVQELVKNKIKSNVPPPLADSTVKAKQAKGVAPVTLIDSTLLLRSISYRVTLD